MGMEFRSLSEDFDTSTATDRLQFSMVLAFNEWWRNSIRDRSVAGQARARAEGRFPGRRPSLTKRERAYIRVERSKPESSRPRTTGHSDAGKGRNRDGEGTDPADVGWMAPIVARPVRGAAHGGANGSKALSLANLRVARVGEIFDRTGG